MKKFVTALTLTLSLGAFAQSALFVVEDGHNIDVQRYIEEVNDLDRDTSFCFTGKADEVISLMWELKNDGEFYPGWGGDHELKSASIKQTSDATTIAFTIYDTVSDEREPVKYIPTCN